MEEESTEKTLQRVCIYTIIIHVNYTYEDALYINVVSLHAYTSLC